MQNGLVPLIISPKGQRSMAIVQSWVAIEEGHRSTSGAVPGCSLLWWAIAWSAGSNHGGTNPAAAKLPTPVPLCAPCG